MEKKKKTLVSFIFNSKIPSAHDTHSGWGITIKKIKKEIEKHNISDHSKNKA